ncbi:MAG: Cytochrome c oxidase subunit 6A, mitochondrial [Heterodermia speciosa]|uniref:Cytochrome c oxidase subunit n=1 Tax=Heterodermia speciosa TaxID=116794 RepID=A0A8H3EUZ3_9LECA|nr:MAG: Cytochrome c oxidase subunit 6A, mitochondrial [Heterodermia speciosa]
MILRNTPQRRLASSEGQPPLTGAADNAFNRERRAVKLHAAESSDLWRKLMIYVTLPCLLLAALNAKNLWDEHWEHEKHRPPLEERVQYSYQNIRTKAFPWGDGDKTLFWNDKVNYKKKSE